MTSYGPSWLVGDDSQYVLPKLTLGWEVLGWTAEWLRNPQTEGPWMYTPEQARLVLWLYEVDENGERTNNRCVVQRSKGWGKDPFAASLCLFELVGNSKFSHFDENGNAVGRPNPQAWVQLVATTKDQNKNTLKMLPMMLPERTIKHWNLDVQKEVIHVKGTGKGLEAVTSNFRTNEGNRPTFWIANEIQHWIPSQGGHDLYYTIRFNSEKVGGWHLAITNAYQPGQDSMGEVIRQAVMAELEGRTAERDWFYDSIEAHPDSPLTPEFSQHILKAVYGDSYWAPIKNITKTLMDTAIPPARLRRMFYNQVIASDDALFNEAELDQNMVDGAALREGDEIVLGFDGGKTDDATALVAIRVSDRMAFAIHIWQAPDSQMAEKWRINEDEVEAMVHMCFRQFKVRAFFADVALWESYINEWGDLYREQLLVKASPNSTIGFDMRGNGRSLGLSNEQLMQTVIDGKQPISRDPLLRRHMLNARRHEDRFGNITFRKESRESKNKVDGYAALLLAYMALQKYLESGRKAKPERDNTVYFF